MNFIFKFKQCPQNSKPSISLVDYSSSKGPSSLKNRISIEGLENLEVKHLLLNFGRCRVKYQ